MITKSLKSALKAMVAGLFILSFVIVSCNDEKKTESTTTETVAPAPAPSTTDTTGKGPMDTGDTKPVKELH